MTNNTQLTEKDIVTTLLEEHKLAISSYATLTMESADQQLRQDATKILNRVFDHQKQIFDIMNQRGWYQVQPANPQEVYKAQQQVNSLQQQ